MYTRQMRSFWLLAVLIVFLGLFLRLYDNTVVPLWWDEALHMERANAVVGGDIFAGLHKNKWLFMPMIGLFQPNGPEGPFIARTLTGLGGVVTTAACIGLGKYFKDQRTGLLAGFIYAILPMAFFHERMILIDPIVQVYGILAVMVSLRLIRQPKVWLAIILSALLAAAFLTKLSGFTFFAVPIMATLLFATSKTFNWSLLYSVSAIVVAAMVIWGTYQIAENQGLRRFDQFQGELDNTIFDEIGDEERGNTLVRNIEEYGQTLSRYMLVLVPALALGSLFFIRGRWPGATSQWQERIPYRFDIIFLWILAFVFALVPILADKPTTDSRLPPRYLMPTVSAMVILAAITLNELKDRFNARWIVNAALLLIVLPSGWFWLTLLSSPKSLPLVRGDDRLYFSPENRNTAAQVVGTELARMWAANMEPQRYGVLTLMPYHHVVSYTGTRTAEVVELRDVDFRDGREPTTVVNWLAEGRRVFITEDHLVDFSLEETETNFVLTEFMADPIPVYEVHAVEGSLADRVAQSTVPRPEQMTADYEALTNDLALAPDGSEVWVYPTNQADALDAQISQPVNPFLLVEWPATQDTLLPQVEQLSNGGDYIDMVVVDEANSDPQRAIATSMLATHYRVDEAFFGLLHRSRYLTGPLEPEWQSIDAIFENVIYLEQAAIVDRTSTGNPVRIALQWRTEAPINDPFNVFVHIFDSNDQLLAQNDGIPGGGLLPMTSWEVDQPVIDRFVVELPPNAAPGTYEVRVGIYFTDPNDPTSGYRLAITSGENTGPDHAVIGQVTIAP